MINSKFGFAGQNQSYSPDSSLTNINRRIEDLANKLIPTRVIDVILDETHPDFEILGGWYSIGVIRYESINSPEKEQIV